MRHSINTAVERPATVSRSASTVERLVKVCQPRHRDDFEGFRDAVIVTLLATTGIRRGELAEYHRRCIGDKL